MVATHQNQQNLIGRPNTYDRSVISKAVESLVTNVLQKDGN